MVSGVVALMLSVNPRLTWRDVPILLAHTARKNDSNDGEWINSPANLRVHPYYGFGVVDADAAVAAAREWISVGGAGRQLRCDSGELIVNRGIPDASVTGVKVQASLNCPQITKINLSRLRSRPPIATADTSVLICKAPKVERVDSQQSGSVVHRKTRRFPVAPTMVGASDRYGISTSQPTAIGHSRSQISFLEARAAC